MSSSQNVDLRIQTTYPPPIAIGWAKLLRVEEAASRTQRVYDLLEITLILANAMLLAGYAAEHERDSLVDTLAASERPSLGHRVQLATALAKASRERAESVWFSELPGWFLDPKGKPNKLARALEELVTQRNLDGHAKGIASTQRDDPARSKQLLERLREVLVGLEELFSYQIIHMVRSEQAHSGDAMQGTIQILAGHEVRFKREDLTWGRVPLRRERVFLRHPTDGRVLDATGWLVIDGGAEDPKLCGFAGVHEGTPELRDLVQGTSPSFSGVYADKSGHPVDFATWFSPESERQVVWNLAPGAAPPAALRPGLRVGGRYSLRRRLGEGSMAEVWEAEDLRERRSVAIKVLRAELGSDEDTRKRFNREADSLRVSHHARVMPCFGVEFVDGRPAMVLPLMGGTLRDRLAKASASQVPGWIEQALEGLVHLHAEGIIHRDIKPGNLFLDGSDRVVVGDLGVALDVEDLRLTHTNERIGTFLYMAPEQYQGGKVGPAADIYALSRVAEALTRGRDPQPAEPSGAKLEGPFGELVRQMGAKSPGDRPTAKDALARIRAIRGKAPETAPKPEGPGCMGGAVRWVASVLGLVGLSAGALVALVAVVWWLRPWAGSGASNGEAVARAADPGATPTAPTAPTAAPAALPSPAEPSNPLGLTLVRVPAGSFVPGAPDAAAGRQEVSISRDLLVSAHEITQGQWTAAGGAPVWKQRFDRFPDSGPRGFREGGACAEVGVGDELPAVCMSWREAIDLCNRLSSLEGLRPAYEITSGEVRWIRHANGYRLLSVAEWEYAARAGKGGAWGDPSVDPSTCRAANLLDLSGVRHAGEALRPQALRCEDGHPGLAPAGSFAPNAWGLHDTVGNVWEWNFDAEDKAGTAAVDPLGALDASRRSRSGGSWRSKPGQASVWQHPRQHVEHYDRATGLRVARWAP